MKYGLLILALFAFAAGCSNELETGYKPKSLGVSTEERKAYYAPAFSPTYEAGRGGEDAPTKLTPPRDH